MTASPALVNVVLSDAELARDPLTLWLREHPDQIERVLPVIVRSTGEFLRLIRTYPQAGKELRRLARQVGAHKLGAYDGRAY